jgi:hypothetical protein
MKFLPTHLRFSAVALIGLLASCDQLPPAISLESEAAEPAGISLPAEVSFNEHIQPILSEYCYHCHGPDAGTREPKDDPLRLDLAENAFALRESLGRAAITKGDAKASKILELMRSADPDVIMPPPESHKKMQPREIALIERWIEQGAEYQAHWAFAPIKRPSVPEAGAEWSKHPIDRFTFEKMAEAGFKPNPPDDPHRFHRRLSFDTTGLPPQPDETAAFVKSYQENPEVAVAAEADRLLATTASAEHFTRHWLDAARYADTHGIHIDNHRSIWPYRDWVIRAFQANMPWDQFTTEQIAGDLLPDRTLDQHVASGFNRCLATTGEGGAIAEEYDAIYAVDRVDTTSAAWLGLTTSCAACHDHKFDPLSTREFYSLTAFFRNNTMSAMDGNNAEHAPAIFVPIPADREQWTALTTQIAAVETELATRKTAARPEFNNWLVNGAIEAPREIDSTLSVHLPLVDAAGPLRGTVDGVAREWNVSPSRIEGPLGMAAVVSDTPIDLGDIGSFSRSDRVTYGGFIRIEGKPTGAVIARMNPGQASRGWDLFLSEGKVTAHIIDSWDKAANKLVDKKPLEPGKWHHVAVVFDGKLSGHQALSIYVDGVRTAAVADPNTVGGNIEANVPLRLGSREGGESKLTGPVALQDFRLYRRVLSPVEIKDLAETSLLRQYLTLEAGKRTKEQNAALFQYFIANVDAPARELGVRIDRLKKDQSELRARGAMSLVMEEKKDSEAFAHVLTRGVYSDKGEKVTANTPAVLPPMPADAPKNRLGLARWLMDPANPLPARVTMNRTWYYFFGTGIVESTQDFGIMGARPTHPKLLDWLASEFIAQRWNYRELIKQIVTSATYRQSGTISAEKLEADPSNLLLARGPRIRLDAEQIRDLALAASGLLSNRVGGPSVKPYQPEGIWEAVAMPQSNTRTYREDSGENLYRRSLYTYWKRTAAPPSMEILNAPSREVTCVRRDRTNTPLQALVLLNDPQFVEAARVLGAKAITSVKDTDGRIDFITSRLLSRTLDAAEKGFVKESHDAALAHYRANPADASQLVAVGASPAATGVDAVELAAWTLISSQIFNLDEAVTR